MPLHLPLPPPLLPLRPLLCPNRGMAVVARAKAKGRVREAALKLVPSQTMYP